MTWTTDPWPHQAYAFSEVLAAIGRGEKRICVTSPTGGGKTRIMAMLIEHWIAEGHKTALYTNRKLLVEQTSNVLWKAGVDHGVRAAGYADDDRFEPVQICSIQTEDARVHKAGRWQLHDAQRVIVDECHIQKADVARKIFDTHYTEGAVRVGFTATPLGIGDLYDCLIQAGKTSELRACGALALAEHYGPDEPDLRGIKAPLGEDLTEKQAVKAMMREGIFGRVLEHYQRLNPEQKPTVLFAPGVAESIWFAEQFEAAGIKAAHIDGQEVWVEGKLHRGTKKLKEKVLDGSRQGIFKVLCNRFVLREGIDAPWLAHGILATVFGSVQSYLQAGGRLLRAYPGMGSVTIQDHGGNWWRHGSLNADREWRLEFTPEMVSGLREDRLRDKQEGEPMLCPVCKMVLNYPRCRRCGWVPVVGWRKSRPVIQQEGQLKIMNGDIFKPHRISKDSRGPEIWKRMYYRSKSSKGERTFRAAMALFAAENKWGWPDKRWPLMPTHPHDFFRLVADVPMERLTSYSGVPVG